MEKQPANLTPRQESAIVALLTGVPAEAAAKVAGVAERTLRNWRRQPAFDAAFRVARRAIFDEALLRSQVLAKSAIEVLGEIMKDETIAAHARVSAAVGVLRFVKDCEVQSLADEVAEVASKVKEMEQKKVSP